MNPLASCLLSFIPCRYRILYAYYCLFQNISKLSENIYKFLGAIEYNLLKYKISTKMNPFIIFANIQDSAFIILG